MEVRINSTSPEYSTDILNPMTMFLQTKFDDERGVTGQYKQNHILLIYTLS